MYDIIAAEIPGLFRIYKDGRIDRFAGTEIIPPSTDSVTGVQSADVTIDHQTGLSARIFLPRIPDPTRKIPLVVYFHGGGFCIESPFAPEYHRHVGDIAAAAGVVAVSVNYRLAPENALPAAFEDAWAAAEWALSAPEGWVREYADLRRVYVMGDSAGATLAHHVSMRSGLEWPNGPKRITGLVTVHPYFHMDESQPDELLKVIFPTANSSDDPRVNPGKDPNLARLECERVLVCLAERDFLKRSGWAYYEALKKSGWAGKLDFFESKCEGHVFHLLNPNSNKATELLKRVVSFLKNEDWNE